MPPPFPGRILGPGWPKSAGAAAPGHSPAGSSGSFASFAAVAWPGPVVGLSRALSVGSAGNAAPPSCWTRRLGPVVVRVARRLQRPTCTCAGSSPWDARAPQALQNCLESCCLEVGAAGAVVVAESAAGIVVAESAAAVVVAESAAAVVAEAAAVAAEAVAVGVVPGGQLLPPLCKKVDCKYCIL